MKRWLVLALALLLVCGTALADTYYVKTDNNEPLSLRDERTNEVLTTIPAGTPLTPDPLKSTDICAYVTYNGYSGLAMWRYLSREAPGGSGMTVTTGVTTPVPTAAPTPAPTPNGGKFTLTTVGAVIQRADNKNKAVGDSYTTLEVTAQDNVVITAKIPRGKKVDYWVINGVRYDFLKTIQVLRVTAFDRSFTVEVAYTKSTSQTLHDPDSIQASRTGERLVVETVNSEMCHLKEKTKGGGGWIKSFDFTDDYNNRATNVREAGGQVTVKIRAIIPRNQKVIGWKLDETCFYPKGNVEQFIVRCLDTSMTYEPIFQKSGTTTAAPPAPPSTPPNDPAPQVTYRVSCQGCTFSGGGYSNATSGTVPAGTPISVSANYSEVSFWRVNGSERMNSNTSFTYTVNRNTSIECIPVVN